MHLHVEMQNIQICALFLHAKRVDLYLILMLSMRNTCYTRAVFGTLLLTCGSKYIQRIAQQFGMIVCGTLFGNFVLFCMQVHCAM